ncbi:hypothetical protein K0M31_002425 [Melipona bicolor]|uniref:Uncharacterized protein n=1 Tax=Melipona bicolor TaxID=60889 RepID=A0AA40GHJ2_9HYME|nr:hypothetical protein K0M31_002425 [Melipona bicolor]
MAKVSAVKRKKGAEGVVETHVTGARVIAKKVYPKIGRSSRGPVCLQEQRDPGPL